MARLRDKLIAHGPLIDELLSSLQMAEMSITLLFAGPSGVGKRFAALVMAQSLLCERSSDACGECPSCLRVEARAHESLYEIKPDGPQIKIDQAREVIEFLHLQRWGKSRVILIDEAQLMNPQAANSLLKILEEPPAGTFIVMTAPSPSSLLATLRSRSRTVLFKPLKENELKLLLPTAPSWVLKAARGSVERARELTESAEQELRMVSAQILESFLAEKEFLVGPNGWRDAVKEKNAFPRILAYWATALRDGLAMQAKAPATSLMNPDQKTLLAQLSKEPRLLLESLWEKIISLQSQMVFHRDPQLAVEELWVFSRNQRQRLE